MRRVRRGAMAVAFLVAVGCDSRAQVATPSASFASLESASPVASPAPATPLPTLAPTGSTKPSPTLASDEEQITALVEAMSAAVRSADSDAYLALVDLSDPVFALEHARWVDDWVAHPVDDYFLRVDTITPHDDGSAAADLTAVWTASGQDERLATLPVMFSLGASGAWRFAGEDWSTTETEHFRVRVLRGLDGIEDVVIPVLPEVYDHVTDSLDYEPGTAMEIKLYADSEQLIAMTQLNLESARGWNEPGEALKLRYDSEDELAPVIAHEMTHFCSFDEAGSQHSRQPWWLEEGTATYVGLGFDPATAEARLSQVREWAADGALVDWSELSDFETTPYELWGFVYGQGFAMVKYVTDTFGEEMRNAWLAAMATEMEIEEATDSQLGLSFEQLNSDFEAWLTN